MATRGRPKHPDILTPREWEVLALIREDLTNDQIGQRLGIGAEGVKYHVSEILGKLSLSSREEAAAWDPRQRPDWTPRWDPTRRPVWATALAPLGLFWRRLAGGLAHSAGSLATVTSVGLGVALVAGITIFAVAVVRTRGSSNDAGTTPPAVVVQPTSQAGPTGKIAFYSDRNGNTEIYVMNANGSGQTNVSHGPGDFSGADYSGPSAWSPDGSRIAFTSDRDGKGEIYVVNADGSGLINVSNDPCGAGGPRWSPDGSRMAFSSGPMRDFKGFYPPPTAGGCVSTIYVVNADGSGRTNLTNGPTYYEEYEGWSPDGSRFAFTSDRTGNTEIYVVNADGSGLTNVSNDPGGNGLSDNPGNDGTAWSPDSSRVSFFSECKVVGGKLDLYVVNADGSGLTYVGHPDPFVGGGFTRCVPSDPSLLIPESAGGARSPDGARFALFVGDGRGNLSIYVVNADGSGLTRLTNGPGDTRPVWSPDSSRIAWARASDGNTGVYVMNADGSGQTNVSHGPEGDALQDGGWSPDSFRIAFGSSRDGNGEIYLVNADGSGLTNLTNNPGEDSGPVWSPAP